MLKNLMICMWWLFSAVSFVNAANQVQRMSDKTGHLSKFSKLDVK